MSGSMDEALRAVEELEDADDDELYRQLGLRIKAMEREPSIAGQYAPPKALLEPMGLTLGDVAGIGRQAFARLSRAGYGLLCSGGQGGRFDAFVATLGTNRMAISAGLATLLVAHIGFATEQPASTTDTTTPGTTPADPASTQQPTSTDPDTPAEPAPNPTPASPATTGS